LIVFLRPNAVGSHGGIEKLQGSSRIVHEQSAPEAFVGGTIAFIKEGDSITIDAHKLLLQLNVDDAEIERRRGEWKKPAPRYTRGVLAKYAALALPANKGAVTG